MTYDEMTWAHTPRVICWWSAGSASAVATKLALAKYPDALVVYCDLSATEHPDNERFLKQCEAWYGKSITRIRSEKYKDTWDVYEKTGWLIGVNGARCTTELKKVVRRDFQRPDDIHVWGFTTSEMKRYSAFRDNNPELQSFYPLIEAGLGHADCHAFLKEAGIELPAMYRLGYKNNNCIGCVKGGMGGRVAPQGEQFAHTVWWDEHFLFDATLVVIRWHHVPGSRTLRC